MFSERKQGKLEIDLSLGKRSEKWVRVSRLSLGVSRHELSRTVALKPCTC